MPEKTKRSEAATFRRGFSRGLGVGLIPLMVCLSLGGGLLYAQSGGDALFIDPKGWIGIGTTTPKATLDVAGKLNVSENSTLSNAAITGSLTTSGSVGVGTTNPGAKLEVAGDTRLNGPVGITGNVIMNGGSVGIGTTTPGPYTLNVAGKGIKLGLEANGGGQLILTNDTNDNKIYLEAFGKDASGHAAELLLTGQHASNVPKISLRADQISMTARYQRDDEPETTYEISSRYHLSLTAPTYGGRTKMIPHDTLVALCGDRDGCQVRLAMTRWTNDTQTESASRTFMFYYSATDGHWRSGWQEGDHAGVDGDGVTQHVYWIWNTCFFTDGTYSNYKDEGDRAKGMQLLVWNNDGHYNNRNRTCELTLID